MKVNSVGSFLCVSTYVFPASLSSDLTINVLYYEFCIRVGIYRTVFYESDFIRTCTLFYTRYVPSHFLSKIQQNDQ
jgi:hypothetical protein